MYLHQALQDANKHDTAVMDPCCRRDEHVQDGCEENGGSKNPVENNQTVSSSSSGSHSVCVLNYDVRFQTGPSCGAAVQTWGKSGSWFYWQRGLFCPRDLDIHSYVSRIRSWDWKKNKKALRQTCSSNKKSWQADLRTTCATLKL